MISITYRVTEKPTDVLRLNTEQEFELKVVSKFVKPPVNANRVYSPSMDYKSGRGTFISAHETFSLQFVFHNDEIAAVDELVYSLFDYQIASLNGVDIPRFNKVQDFRLTTNSFTAESVGCFANRATIEGIFL